MMCDGIFTIDVPILNDIFKKYNYKNEKKGEFF